MKRQLNDQFCGRAALIQLAIKAGLSLTFLVSAIPAIGFTFEMEEFLADVGQQHRFQTDVCYEQWFQGHAKLVTRCGCEWKFVRDPETETIQVAPGVYKTVRKGGGGLTPGGGNQLFCKDDPCLENGKKPLNEAKLKCIRAIHPKAKKYINKYNR